MKGFEDISKLAMNSQPADSVEEAARGRECVLEPKFDGIRLLVHVTEDGVRMYSRAGNSKTGALPHVDEELSALPAGTWLDGEAVSFNPDGTQAWGEASSVVRSAPTKFHPLRGKISFVVFDILAYDGMDARSLPLRQRRELLERHVLPAVTGQKVTLSPWLPVDEGTHDALLERGYEGSMVKLLDAPYESDKRSWNSRKLKAEDTVDAVITGFSPSKDPESWIAKAGLIGTVDFKHFHGGEWVEGRASGMNVPMRREMTARQDDLVGTVVEVGYMTRMPSGKIRHPQFKRLRDDKTAEECAA